MSLAIENLFRAAEAWAKIKGYGVRSEEADLVMEEALRLVGFDSDLDAIVTLELTEDRGRREVCVIFESGLRLAIPLERRSEKRG